MPAPSQTQLELTIKNAMLSQGFVKRIPQDGAIVEVPGELPEDMENLAKALAIGISQTWATWQVTQVVSIPVTSVPGTPSVGILP